MSGAWSPAGLCKCELVMSFVNSLILIQQLFPEYLQQSQGSLTKPDKVPALMEPVMAPSGTVGDACDPRADPSWPDSSPR